MQKNNCFVSFIIVIVTIIWWPSYIYAQTVYEGQILDKETDLPLLGTTVALSKRNTSTQANDQGYFKLIATNGISDDTLIFTCIGYKSYKIPVKSYAEYLYIKLEPTSTMLNEVFIKAGKSKKLTLEKFSLADIPKNKETSTGVMIGATQFKAKLFETPVDSAKLLRVLLGRRDLGSNLLIKTNKFARFIVHIKKVDKSTGSPGESLFAKEVVLQDNSRLVSVNFEKDNIKLPSTFFIAIEYLFIPYNEAISIGPAKKSAGINKEGKQVLEDAPVYIVQYQPFIANYKLPKSQYGWTMNNSGIWVSSQSIETMALSVTILY